MMMVDERKKQCRNTGSKIRALYFFAHKFSFLRLLKTKDLCAKKYKANKDQKIYAGLNSQQPTNLRAGHFEVEISFLVHDGDDLLVAAVGRGFADLLHAVRLYVGHLSGLMSVLKVEGC